MSIASTELTSRMTALKGLFTTAATPLPAVPPETDPTDGPLETGLPETPSAYLGPARETQDGKNFQVFVARSGLPEIVYDMGTHTAEWTVEFEVALQVYWPQSSEQLETYMATFAANALSVLHANAKRDGADGWNKGIIKGTDAIRFRKAGREGCYEVEVIPFHVTFEVSV